MTVLHRAIVIATLFFCCFSQISLGDTLGDTLGNTKPEIFTVAIKDIIGRCGSPDTSHIPQFDSLSSERFEQVEIDAGSIAIDDEGNIRMTDAVLMNLGDVQLFGNTIEYLKNDNVIHLPLGGGFISKGAQFTAENITVFRKTNSAEISKSYFSFGGTMGNGSANFISLDRNNTSFLVETYFTSCDAQDPEWRLQAQNIEIDHHARVGTARDSFVLIGNVPVLYFSHFSFAVGGRKSGFLVPRYDSSELTGGALSIPYYWNIKPESDWTITPYLFFNSGLLLHNEWRTLLPGGTFTNQLSFIKNQNNTHDPTLPSFRWLNSTEIKTSGKHYSFSLQSDQYSDTLFTSHFGNVHQFSARYTFKDKVSLRSYGDYYTFSITANKDRVNRDADDTLVRTDNSGAIPTIRLSARNWSLADNFNFTFTNTYSDQYNDQDTTEKFINRSGLSYTPWLSERTRLFFQFGSYYRTFISEKNKNNPLLFEHEELTITSQPYIDFTIVNSGGIGWDGTYSLTFSVQQFEFRADGLVNNLDSVPLPPSYHNYTSLRPLAGYDRLLGYDRITLGSEFTEYSSDDSWTRTRLLASHVARSEFSNDDLSTEAFINQTLGFFSVEHLVSDDSYVGFSIGTSVYDQNQYAASLFAREQISEESSIAAVVLRKEDTTQHAIASYKAGLGGSWQLSQSVQYNLTNKTIVNTAFSFGWYSCCVTISVEAVRESTIAGPLQSSIRLNFSLVDLFDKKRETFFGKIHEWLQ